MVNNERRIALAIQKPTGKTNMGEDTAALLKAGGLEFRLPSREDDAPTNLSGVDIWLARNSDITRLVSLGVRNNGAALGIVGRDKFDEFQNGSLDRPTPIVLKDLGYSFCTLKLGVDEGLAYDSLRDLQGLTVATSFPVGTERFFAEAGVNVRILECEGGAETYVKRGAAQACVEISDTGSSMRANKIRPVADVMKSEAILIADSNLIDSPDLAAPVWRALRAVMTGLYATQTALVKFNFPKDQLEDILKNLPARKSPTILQSGNEGWLAAESLVPRQRYNEIKQLLFELGAEDIFQLPVLDPSPNRDDPEVDRMMKALYGESWQLPSPAYSLM